MSNIFNVKKFSSGEYEVTLNQRLHFSESEPIKIHFNWFNEEERDITLLMMKIDAVKTNYPTAKIEIYAPYLPYLRQDRIFEVGQGIPALAFVKALRSLNVGITTMGAHSDNFGVFNITKTIKGNEESHIQYYLFPDSSAKNHYNLTESAVITHSIEFRKERSENGIELKAHEYDLERHNRTIQDSIREYVIFDDIVAGGRTFIECAKYIRANLSSDKPITLVVYHAFLDHGLDDLEDSGITKIGIINPDSFEYISKLYPDEISSGYIVNLSTRGNQYVNF